MKKIKKKKAFVGAIVEGVRDLVGTATGLITASNEAKAKRKEFERQQGEIYNQEALQLGQALSLEANQQEGYVNAMKSRVGFKMGGKAKTKRIKKKCAVGGNIYGGTQAFGAIGNEYSGQALGGGITGQTVSGIINAIKGPADQLVLKHNAPAQAQQAKVIRTPNQPIQQMYPQNVVQNPVLNQAKLGTKRVKQRNTNRFK